MLELVFDELHREIVENTMVNLPFSTTNKDRGFSNTSLLLYVAVKTTTYE